MNKLSLFSLAAAACMCSCVSATVSVDNICAKHDIVLPAAPAGVPVLPGFVVSKDFPVNLSDAISKIKDVGDLSVWLNSFTLNDGDFSWVSHVKATASVNMQPALTLVDVDVAGSTTSINLPMAPDVQAQLIEMLKAGEVSITVYLTTGDGTLPTSDEDITGTLCVGASVSASKSL